MVRIIDLEDSSASEVSDDNSENDAEENDEGIEEDKPAESEPDDPTPPAAAHASAPEPAASGEESPGPSAGPASTADEPRRFISPVLRLGLSRQHVWHLLNRYGNRIELCRALGHYPINSDELSRLASELQHSAGLINPTNPQFTVSFVGPMTPADEVTEDSGPADREVVSASSENSSDLSQTTDDKEDNSALSAREKSNGLGEKEQLAAAVAKVSLVSSPDASDCGISDVSDSIAPHPGSPHLEKKQEENTPLTLNFTWVKELDSIDIDDAEPELAQLAGMEVSEASDEAGEAGGASALPNSSTVKSSWEDWASDDRLFSLESEAAVAMPSTSRASEERIPSPTTERRRVKLENRQRVRERGTVRTLTRYILVPTEKIGRIVGKGGKRISSIEKQSGAKIKIENRKSSDPVTQITLNGTDEEIQAADREICLIVRNFKPPESGEPATASVSNFNEDQLKKMLVDIKNQVLDGEKNCRLP